jgi:hypothetical protein
MSRCVILQTRTVATGRFGKVIRASHQIINSIAARSWSTPWVAADLLQVGTKRGPRSGIERTLAHGLPMPAFLPPWSRRVALDLICLPADPTRDPDGRLRTSCVVSAQPAGVLY